MGKLESIQRDRIRKKVSDGFDFVLPGIDTLYEPLHAIYSKDCIGPIETIFSQQKKVIIELFNYVKARFVDREEVNRFDPDHLSLKINATTQKQPIQNYRALRILPQSRMLARGQSNSEIGT